MERSRTLRSLAGGESLASSLREHGLGAAAADAAASRFARAARALIRKECREEDAARAFFVPGRIEVLGKHTDYAGGRSLLAAVEAGIAFVGVARDDVEIHLMALDMSRPADLKISAAFAPRAGHYWSYIQAVVRRLGKNFSGPLWGASFACTGDLPPAAGMSSSSALVVGTALLLSEINGLRTREEYRPLRGSVEQLAGYFAAIENGQSFGSLEGDRGVGTFGGSEDHTAILCCRAGWLSQYSFCPVRGERSIRMPPEQTFVIAASGIAAEKTGAARDLYNRASSRAAEAARIWREATGRDDPHLAAVLRSGERGEVLGELRKLLRAVAGLGAEEADALARRAEQFAAESEEIIPAAGDALVRGDLDAFGALVDRSQSLAETHLGNQVPETVFLARSARECGARAASAFGAGFGGSVWAMVDRARAEELRERWRRLYGEAFPAAAQAASFFTTDAGPAAFEL